MPSIAIFALRVFLPANWLITLLWLHQQLRNMSMGPLLGSRRANSPYHSTDVLDLSEFMDLLASNRPSNVLENLHLPVDWKETQTAHIIKADIPGLTKDDVKVEVEEGKRVLKISGEVSKKEVQKNETYLYLERMQGSFSRRLRLPDNCEIDRVEAKMDKGVLTVIIPKTPGREPRIKTIQLSE